MLRISNRVSYQWHHLLSRIRLAKSQRLDRRLRKQLGCSLLDFLNDVQPELNERRLALLKQMNNRPLIAFTFRTLHFMDWFIPVHLALERLFPGVAGVIYLDYATTLRRIGSGLEYFRYRGQVRERLSRHGIDPLLHWSHEELLELPEFPGVAANVTCESIRQEKLDAPIRIYLPHYALPKKIDRGLPDNIRFNHVFLPTRPPYTYAGLNTTEPPDGITLHHVGYPKFHLSAHLPAAAGRDPSKPVVLYAPSLEIPLLLGAIEQGLLTVFRRMYDLRFIVKLHPSLASRRHYIASFIMQQLRGEPHIRFDSLASLQELMDEATVLLTDFGSTGGEWSLGLGKRVVFLKVPEGYEGGADLRFRDDFADGVCTPVTLERTLRQVLSLQPPDAGELSEIRARVLSFKGSMDEEAARVLHELLLQVP